MLDNFFSGLRRRYYRAIVIDPPWHFKSNSKAKPGRNAIRHYKVMSLAEIEALPVESLAADDCALFLWITGPMLTKGVHVQLFKAWGFKPSGMGFVWIKLNPSAQSRWSFNRRDIVNGTGHTTRKGAEFCLIGKRGRSVRRSTTVHEVIIAPRREHSRKPDESYHRIERYTAGPYLDLFSRTDRRGWTTWGDETGRFG